MHNTRNLTIRILHKVGTLYARDNNTQLPYFGLLSSKNYDHNILENVLYMNKYNESFYDDTEARTVAGASLL